MSVESIAVLTGARLTEEFAPVSALNKRDCFNDVWKWIESESDKVGILYGLAKTGKTTLIGQIVGSLPPDRLRLAAYVLLNADSTMRDVRFLMRDLYEKGYRYFFVDEATAPKDFIGSASLYSDIYAQSGAKVLLSGKDSLGFFLAKGDTLYDRCVLFHTSYIPYREFERVLGIRGIDRYLEYGGTMCADGTDDGKSVFSSSERTGEYVDSAIATNIRHSLETYRDGSRMMHLRELYLNGELTGAINRVVESVNHEFALRTLIRQFESHDFGSVRQQLNAKEIETLGGSDVENITSRLKYLLQIKNEEEYRTGLTEARVKEIELYLKKLDLVAELERRDIDAGTEVKYSVFTQSGLRFSQVKDLIETILKDSSIRKRSAAQKAEIAKLFEDEVKGRMMDDIVLYDTMVTYPGFETFKLQFDSGEIDMVVYDPKNHCCALYETERSAETNPLQTRHLNDEDVLGEISDEYGPVIERGVIYRGKTGPEIDGVRYVNADDFLSSRYDLGQVMTDGGQTMTIH